MGYAALYTQYLLMNVRIKTSCALCGDVELNPEEIELFLTDNGDHYRFRCPLCGQNASRPSTKRLTSILMSSGVLITHLRTDDVITEAEIEAFVDGLAHVDWSEL